MRPPLVSLLGLLLVASPTAGQVHPSTENGSTASIETLTEEDNVDRAIARGIRYLVSKQRDDGAITDRQYDTTMTSLALMALASTGITPGYNAPHADVSRKALDFVLRDDRQDKQGYYGTRTDGARQ